MPKSRHSKFKQALKRGMRRNVPQRYAIERSPLWRLTSVHLLARLLGVSVDDLAALADAPVYNRFIADEGTSKARNVQEPLGLTMKVHYRLVRLLDRIVRPNFLHSATKTRSNITNAAQHQSGQPLVKSDIRKFYESTNYLHVKSFFLGELGWPHDLARLISKIATVENQLPTGSALSPLLSYYAHRQTFTEIEALCATKGVVLTLYVDDITLSGERATKSLLFEVKELLHRRGLTTHKDQYAHAGQVAVVTGVAVGAGRLRLRNAQHLAIVSQMDDDLARGVPLSDSLQGKLASARAVDSAAADALKQRYLAKRGVLNAVSASPSGQ